MRVTDDGVLLDIDGTEQLLTWMWLRDHAQDESSYLKSAEQRLVPPSVVAAAEPGTASMDGDTLRVSWGDVSAEYPPSMFATPTTWAELAVPWTSLEPAEFAYDTFAGDGFGAILTTLATDGVVVVRDVPTNTATTRAALERFGYIRSSIFGDLWTFQSDGGFDDTASTPLEITPHTDGTYCHDAPGMLALHCHVYDATGGENVFVDAHTVAEHLSADDRDLLSSIEIPGRYIGDGAHLEARRPALRYVDGALHQVSYNHHDRAPFLLPEPTMTELYRALHRFDALVNDAELQLEVELRPGDMVCFDNWRVLHGRRAFRGDRFIAGGYINREDLESALRLAS